MIAREYFIFCFKLLDYGWRYMHRQNSYKVRISCNDMVAPP